MIEMENIGFSYGKKPFLEGLNARIHDGELTALIGPNGAGKSTVLRLCARLLSPAAGSIRLDGADIRPMKPKTLAKQLAFLPQSRPTPMISVQSLVMHGRFAHMGAKPSAADRSAVERALDWTGMTGLAGRELRTLSGGQRQKAFLAMLIAQEAKHILLDEPLTYLDVSCQLEVLDILTRLKAQGCCIAMVVHDLALVPEYCDRALLMHKGRLLYDGSAQTLFETTAIEHAFGVRPVRRERFTFEKSSTAP